MTNQNDDIQMSNIIDNQAFDTVSNTNSTNTINKIRNVKLVYCGDGVVEECEEDELERERLEKEEKERQLELQRQQDLEAKNFTWLPWFKYMTFRTANKSFEACDYAGEKLAWWLGITKPKYLYEIQEYNRMKLEQEQFNVDDIAEEIIIGEDNNYTITNNSNQLTELNRTNELDLNKRLFIPSNNDHNINDNKHASGLSNNLFQNNN